MARVVWSEQAIDDLDGIDVYVAQFNVTAAKTIRVRLVQLGESLAHLPNRGRPAAGNMRELTTVSPYVLRYRADGNLVVIVRIRHSSRRP